VALERRPLILSRAATGAAVSRALAVCANDEPMHQFWTLLRVGKSPSGRTSAIPKSLQDVVVNTAP
jgi:hypothetical protein